MLLPILITLVMKQTFRVILHDDQMKEGVRLKLQTEKERKNERSDEQCPM